MMIILDSGLHLWANVYICTFIMQPTAHYRIVIYVFYFA